MEIYADKDHDMTAIAHDDLRSFAATRWPKLNHKGRLRELARVLPFGNRRVRAIYNSESGVRLRADEQQAIAQLTREAADALRQSQENYRALEARIAQLEGLFARVDEEFGGEFLAALRASAGGTGQGHD